MIPPRTLTGVKTRAIGSHQDRASLNLVRLIVGPYALAGNRREPLVAGLCLSLLAVVSIVEVSTPDIVVGAFAILPLLAAAWALSGRMATLVAIAATLLFGLAVAIETTNRVTVILVGVAGFIPAPRAWLFSQGGASLPISPRPLRPAVSRRAAPATRDGIYRMTPGR